MQHKTFTDMIDLLGQSDDDSTKHSIGLVRYDVIDESTNEVCDHCYEIDGKLVSKQRAIDYTLHKKCFHVLSNEDRVDAYRIESRG